MGPLQAESQSESPNTESRMIQSFEKPTPPGLHMWASPDLLGAGEPLGAMASQSPCQVFTIQGPDSKALKETTGNKGKDILVP